MVKIYVGVAVNKQNHKLVTVAFYSERIYIDWTVEQLLEKCKKTIGDRYNNPSELDYKIAVFDTAEMVNCFEWMSKECDVPEKEVSDFIAYVHTRVKELFFCFPER